MARGAFLIEIGFACGGIPWARLLRFHDFLIAALLADIVNPSHDIGDFTVAEVRELRHGRKLWGLRNTSAKQRPDQIPIFVLPDELRVQQVGSFAVSNREVDTVTVNAPVELFIGRS